MFELESPYFPYRYFPYSEEAKEYMKEYDQSSKPEIPTIYSFERYLVPEFIPLQGMVTLKE